MHQASADPRRAAAPARRVIGLAIRTTNPAESKAETARIPALWGRFMQEGWSQKLEQVGASGPVTAVYSAYKTGAAGSYQLLVGREVRAAATLPQGIEVVSAPAGTYLVFTCSGPMPQAVMDGWLAVWSYFARANAPARAYTCDFEFYDERSAVELWIAIRDA